MFIYDKMLVVPVNKPNLIQFLDYPDNRANGGAVFERVNKEAPKARR